MSVKISEANESEVMEVQVDYKQFVPEFERLLEKSGRMRVLFDMVDFHGLDAGGSAPALSNASMACAIVPPVEIMSSMIRQGRSCTSAPRLSRLAGLAQQILRAKPIVQIAALLASLFFPNAIRGEGDFLMR